MSEFFFETNRRIGVVVLAEFIAENIEHPLAAYSTKGWDINTDLSVPSYMAESTHDVYPNEFVIRGPVQVNERDHYAVAIFVPKAKFKHPEDVGNEHVSKVLGYLKDATGMKISPVNTNLENLLRILES